MRPLTAAELSRLSRIASNPRLAKARWDESIRDLSGVALEAARILMGEDAGQFSAAGIVVAKVLASRRH